MLAAGYGKIINTASMSGSIVNTPQNQMVYNTTKAGVIHLTKSLAAEWAPRGVRVNCISPGYPRTQLVTDLLDTPVGKEVSPQWMALTPQHKMAEVTDLQGAIVYLAAEVSDFMTGHDRELGDSPRVVHHAQVAVAYPAVVHLELNFVGPEFTGIIFKGLELTARLMRRVCFDHLGSSVALGLYESARSKVGSSLSETFMLRCGW